MSNKVENSPALITLYYAAALWITFICGVCKIIGIVGWSWLWVLSPLWLPTAIIFLVVLIAAICLLLGEKEAEDQDYRIRSRYQKRA